MNETEMTTSEKILASYTSWQTGCNVCYTSDEAVCVIPGTKQPQIIEATKE